MTRASRKRWLSRGAALAAVASLAAPAAALAADRVTLSWSAPPECPGAIRVTNEVDRLLGDRSPPSITPLEVTATVSAASTGGFVGRIETPSDDGSRVREIKGSSCADIANATALIIALMIDPAAVSRAPPAPPGPAALPAPPAPVALLAPSPPAPRTVLGPAPPAPRALPEPAPVTVPPSPFARPSLRVGAWVAADAGSLPGVSAAFGGKVALALGRLRLELGAGVWPDRDGYLAGSTTKGAGVGLVAGSAGACWSFFGPGRIELGPCVSLEFGRVHADGFGVDLPGHGASLWSALPAGGLFAWSPAEHLAFFLRVDAVVPFARPSFTLMDLGAVHRASAVAGRAATGVELRF